MPLPELTSQILRFRDERDWQQYHSPRHLAAAVAIEAAELQELFLWRSDEEVLQFIAGVHGASRLREEIADVLIYALLLADSARIDPEAAIREKLAANAKKYPISEARGNAVKYSERGSREADDPTE